MSVLALVPARGGSQGIPRKNLHPVGGYPLIVWSIGQALASTRVDRVIVSTDDDEIAAVAVAAGADVPFRRPADLAGPAVTDLPVFQHCLAWLAEAEGYRPDLVVHLRPTSPVRPVGLIDEAVDAFTAEPDATALRSVSPTSLTPWKMWEIGEGGWLMPVLGSLAEEDFNQPRQLLPPAWIHDGVIDIIRPEVIAAGSMTGSRILAFLTPTGTGVDIDHPEDLAAAEAALDELGRTTPNLPTRPAPSGGYEPIDNR